MGLLLFDVLFVCSLPFVPKCTLFRLHDTAMSVNSTGIKGCFQRTELFIGQFHIGSTEVFQDTFLILRTGDGHHVGIFVEHPCKGNLCVGGVLLRRVFGKDIKHGLVGDDVLAAQLRHEFAYIVHRLKLCVRLNLAGKEAAGYRGEGHYADVVLQAVREYGSVEKRWGFSRLKINSFTLRHGKRLFEHVGQYSTTYTDIGLLLHSWDIPDFNGDTY